MKVWLCALILTIVNCTMSAQRLNNPSFEGEPVDATMPAGWHSCREGTTPDILPGPWGVSNQPHNGRTYVGLITRLDGSQEAIGQQFAKPLEANQCYTMALAVGHSQTYAGHNENGRIRIWLGEDKCDRSQLVLDKSVTNSEVWKVFPIRFHTEDEYRYIILENEHQAGRTTSESNILIDHLRWPVRCEGT